MNRESIKTATLIVLIVISLFFTWNMWNLQPTYEYFQNQTVFESTPISQESREVYEVIKPQNLMLYTSSGNEFSTLDGSYMNTLWKEMQGWEYRGEKIETFTKDAFHDWIYENEGTKLELKFYDEIPMTTFQSMLEWDEDPNEHITFDRIFLDISQDPDVEQNVYFVSYENMELIKTSVENAEASRFVAELIDEEVDLQQYFAFDTGQGFEIMLPEEKVKLDSYQYMTEEIEGESFKDSLFSNPRIVKRDANKNRYTDGTRELNINTNQHAVKYVNPPMLSDTSSIEESVLIKQSIAFLNDHGGFTDDYVLFDIQDNQQEIRFIMTIQSIPVVPVSDSMENRFGPTMISQRWGQNEIASYDRPSYHRDFTIEKKSQTLMSGRKVVELISNNEQIEETEINNIFIAYELSSSNSQQVVNVSPVWCIETKDGRLMTINDELEQSGGNENGLE
jgi:regulatory protein YycH of two-component signal transduction system YycFG